MFTSILTKIYNRDVATPFFNFGRFSRRTSEIQKSLNFPIKSGFLGGLSDNSKRTK